MCMCSKYLVAIRRLTFWKKVWRFTNRCPIPEIYVCRVYACVCMGVYVSMYDTVQTYFTKASVRHSSGQRGYADRPKTVTFYQETLVMYKFQILSLVSKY